MTIYYKNRVQVQIIFKIFNYFYLSYIIYNAANYIICILKKK